MQLCLCFVWYEQTGKLTYKNTELFYKKKLTNQNLSKEIISTLFFFFLEGDIVLLLGLFS